MFKLQAHTDIMLVRASLCCYCIIFRFDFVFISMRSMTQQSLSHFVSVVSHPQPTIICHTTQSPPEVTHRTAQRTNSRAERQFEPISHFKLPQCV